MIFEGDLSSVDAGRLAVTAKITGSHVHCKSANISETVQDRDVVTIDH